MRDGHSALRARARRTGGAALLGLLLFGAPRPAAGLEELSFVAPAVVHFRVAHVEAAGELRFELTVTDPAGAETLLLDGPSAPLAVRVPCEAANGVWTYRATLETEEGTQISEYPVTVEKVINGHLQFDETVTLEDEGFALGVVTVKSGLKLTAAGTWLLGGGSLLAAGGTVLAGEGLFDRISFSATGAGAVQLDSSAVCSLCTFSASDGGTLSVADGTQVSSSTFTFASGGAFQPGSASFFNDNRFCYRQPGLSGASGLTAEKGTLVLQPGAEHAALSGEGYDIEVQTAPVQLNISRCRLQIQTALALSSGVADSDVQVGSAIFPSTFTGAVQLNGLGLSSLSLYGAESCEVLNCEVKGATVVSMGAPVLQGCQLIGGLTVIGGSRALITGNALHGTLTYLGYEPAFGVPTVEDNDLLGPQALRFEPLGMFATAPPAGVFAVGPCYYGSARGPMLDQGGGFLGQGKGHQGGWVTAHATGEQVHARPFTLAAFRNKRVTAENPQTYEPAFWVAGWASGQGSLDWSGPNALRPLYKQIPTLLSFDVKTTGRQVGGQRFSLRLNNTTVLDPTSAPKALSRDLADFKKSQVRLGLTTVNFTLPETEEDTLTFELLREESAGGQASLASGTLTFSAHPWQRPLRVAVIPISVNYTFSAVKPPAAAPVSRFLQYVLPSMLPIPPSMLQVEVKAAESMDTHLGLLSNLPGMAALAAKLSLWYVDAPAQTPYDLVVAVMPPDSIRPVSAEINYMTGIAPPADGVNYGYGDNFWLSTSRVLFTDAEKPMAMLHELGHAAGLYREVEQYDQPDYAATEGMPLRGFSSAALDAVGNVVNGFPAHGIVHFAETNMVWHDPYYEWIDVMGLPETQVWPSSGTAGNIFSYFTGALQPQAPAASPPPDDGPAAADGARAPAAAVAPAPAGAGAAVMLSGVAVTREQRTVLTAGHNAAMETSLLPRVAPALPEASNWFQFGKVCFCDASSQLLQSATFKLPLCYNQEDWWSGTWPLPAACRRVELRQTYGGIDTLVDAWEAGGTLSVALDPAYLPAGEVRGELQVVWNAAAAAPTPATRLLSQLSVSTNQGLTWLAVGGPTERSSSTVSTEAFAAGTPLALRVTVSDGFSSAADSVTGLVVGDRAPRLTLLDPREGDLALAGETWELRAEASDSEDGALSVAWHSSRDGALTTPATLSEGTHLLTASAADSGGHLVQTSVTVRVSAAAASADLSVDALRLVGYHQELRERERLSEGGLLIGQVNTLHALVRNSGVAVEADARLRVRLPDHSEELLPAVTFRAEPFAQVLLTFAYRPTQPGVYRFEAQVEPRELADRTPGNNRLALEGFTLLPALLVRDDYGRKEFVSMTERGYPTYEGYVIPLELSQTLRLYNGGYVPLTITQVALTGLSNYYAPGGGFRLRSPPAFPLTLQPGQDVTLELQHRATAFTPVLTGLRVLSSDPLRPDFVIPVRGWMYDPEDTSFHWQDQDGDGIPSYIELAIGLDPDNADHDADGLADGAEDRNANGTAEAWETGARTPDSDGDGLLDGEERDTSPLFGDSDGDGLSDGDEAHARTDGRDALDRLRISAFSLLPDGLSLEWEGRASVPYEIYVSEDLRLWQKATAGSTPEEQPDRLPRIDGPARYRAAGGLPTSRFYTVRVPAAP